MGMMLDDASGASDRLTTKQVRSTKLRA